MKFIIKQKIFSFRDNFVIKNEYDEPEIIVEGKLLTLKNKLTIYERNMIEIFYIEELMFSLLPEYKIYQNGHEVANIKKKLSFLAPKIDITSKFGEFTIDGDFLAYNFTINQNGIPVAEVNKKFISFTDEYILNIFVNENVDFLITLVIVIDQMLHDNKNR